MHRLRITCMIALAFAVSSSQPVLFNSVQARPAIQGASQPQQSGVAGGEKAPTEQKQPDYSQEAFIIEQMATSYRFEKDGTGLREQSFRAKIQSEAGVEAFGQLIFPYISENEKLEIEYVKVRKPDGSEVAALESNVQDLTAPISREAPVYTDLRQKHVTVPGLRPGDTLEYRIVWRVFKPLAPNHFWLAHEFLKSNWIVLDARLTVDVPLETTIKLKTEPGLEPAVEEAKGRRIYNWKSANLKRPEKSDKET